MSFLQSRSIVKGGHICGIILPDLWYNGATACATAIYALIYVVVARALGPHIFGSYLFARWLATIGAPAIGIGMSTLASRRIAEIQRHEPPRLMAGIFYHLWYRQHRGMFCYNLAYISLTVLLARFIHVCTPGILLLASLSTLPSLLSTLAGTTLRSLRRVDLLAMLHLFGALLSLFFIIVATQINDKPVEAFLLALALSSTLTLFLSLICIMRLLPLEQALQPGVFLRERLTCGLRHRWQIVLPDAIIWQRSELLLLACWCSPAELGFYALSAGISAKMIGLAPTLFGQWLFPLALRYVPNHHYLNPYDAFIKTSCYIIFLAVPIYIALVILSPNLILYCFGETFLPIVQPLRILLTASIFGSLATVSLTHLSGLEDISTQQVQHMQSLLHAGIACLKIGLGIPAILLWGPMGAACSCALAQIASALTSFFLCQQLLKKCQNPYPLPGTGP